MTLAQPSSSAAAPAAVSNAAANAAAARFAALTEKLAYLPPEGLDQVRRAYRYADQAHHEAWSASPLYGWKIAATSQAGQQHIHVDGPLAGRLLAERVLPAGACFSLAGNQMRVCEGEFAFRMGQTLAPRERPITL